MKKILITGANSYIGVSFEKYIYDNYPNDYIVDTVDMIDGSWRDCDFSQYDSVFHVAGIAHQKETKQNASLYYQVNRDLAVETAQKSKDSGVKQFIFLSSMSVYGLETGVITKETVPNPKNNYGKSKLQAEQRIFALSDDSFKVCVIRPPMVYGKNCKGNFQTVVKIVKMFPVFPKISNKRSMISIDNLSVFIKFCIDKDLQGIYYPQNKEYVKTIDMANIIAKRLGKQLYFSYLLGIAVFIMRLFFPIAKKGFGTLIYSNMEDFKYIYCISNNADSISKSL